METAKEYKKLIFLTGAHLSIVRYPFLASVETYKLIASCAITHMKKEFKNAKHTRFFNRSKEYGI